MTNQRWDQEDAAAEPKTATRKVGGIEFAPAKTVATGASASALAQREVGEVQAAMVIAKRFPRDQITSMERIIQACTRPSFAESAAYQYARGGTDITGPSIRLAEELARGWGNILSGVTELTRENGVSECLAYAWDLESNYRDEKRFHVRHWRDTKQGGYAVKDERDIYELIANMGARRKRACILSVIPSDVQEAAVAQCEQTLQTKIQVTPERIKGMLERFAEYGVTKDMIEERIQRRLEALTPALLVNLGKIYNSLQDGMSVARDWFTFPEVPETPTQRAVRVAAKEQEHADRLGRLTGQDPGQEEAPPAEEDQAPPPTEDPPQEAATAPRGRVGRRSTRGLTGKPSPAEDAPTGQDGGQEQMSLTKDQEALLKAAEAVGLKVGQAEVEIDTTIADWTMSKPGLYHITVIPADRLPGITKAMEQLAARRAR